jgi:hypothetical protein
MLVILKLHMFDIHLFGITLLTNLLAKSLLVSLTTRLGSTEDLFQQGLAWIGKEDWVLMTLQLADEVCLFGSMK